MTIKPLASNVDDTPFNKARDAFLAHTPNDWTNLGRLHDVLIDSDGVDGPLTPEQVKAVVRTLPAYLFSMIIAHGWNDTVMADEVWEYVNSNKEKVLATLQGGRVVSPEPASE